MNALARALGDTSGLLLLAGTLLAFGGGCGCNGFSAATRSPIPSWSRWC